MDAVDIIALIAIGFAGGALGGLLGIGGGTIFVPGLVILVGTAQIDAQGVSLAAIVITAAVALTVHLRQGTVHRGVAAWAVAPAVGLSVLGAYVAAQLEGDTLQRIFGVMLLLVSLRMLASVVLRWKATPPDGGDGPAAA